MNLMKHKMLMYVYNLKQVKNKSNDLFPEFLEALVEISQNSSFHVNPWRPQNAITMEPDVDVDGEIVTLN